MNAVRDMRLLTRLPLAVANALAAAAGAVLAAGDNLTVAVASSGVLLLAAGCSALNQVQERDLDARMERTCQRPLPLQHYTVLQVCLGAGVLLTAGALSLGLRGITPLFLGLTAVILYNGVYTPLKRTRVLSLLPGTLAGALPPLIGWTAAGGGINDARILLLCGALILWQIPHTLLFIHCYRADLRRAGLDHFAELVTGNRGRKLISVWLIAFAASCALLPLCGVIVTPPGRLLSAGLILWLTVLVAFVARVEPGCGCDRQLRALLGVLLLACIGNGLMG